MIIRHSRQTRAGRYSPAVLRLPSFCVAAGLAACCGAQPASEPAAAPASVTNSAPEESVEPADVHVAPGEDAATLLQQSRDTIMGFRTLKAQMTETVEFGPRRLKAEGQYLQGPENRLRIELEVTIGENKGSLVQISEGDVLWTIYNTGPTPKITRRDVKQILAAAKSDQAKATLTAELGLGGLPSLLTAIEQSMAFKPPLATKIDGRDFFVLEGTWKPAIAAQFQQQAQQLPDPSTEPRPLPAHIPDVLRLYLDAETHFPYRIRYLKRAGAAGVAPIPLLTIDFRDIVVNQSLDPNEFRYSAPQDADVKDVTRMYLPAGSPAAPTSPTPMAPAQ